MITYSVGHGFLYTGASRYLDYEGYMSCAFFILNVPIGTAAPKLNFNMKRMISTALLLFSLAATAGAQTTWEDYRYITAGLKDDLQKGKNIKEGHSLGLLGGKESVTQSGIQRNAQLYYFKKGTQNKAIVIQCSDSHGNTSYFCIPSSNAPKDIWDEAFRAIQAGGQEWQLVFSWALVRTLSLKL